MERRPSLAQLVERTFVHAAAHIDKPIHRQLINCLDIRNGEIAQMRALIALSQKLAPPLRLATERLFLQDSLPFAARPTFMTHGANKSAWKMENPQSHTPFVCRVHFHTMGMSACDLSRYAHDAKYSYEAVQDTFAGYEHLVVPAHFMLAHSPTRGTGAVVEVTPFIEGHDIFDLPDSYTLTDDQKKHAGIIAEAASRKMNGRYLDLLGGRNILVTEQGSTCVVDWEPAPLPNHDHYFRHYQRVKTLKQLSDT